MTTAGRRARKSASLRARVRRRGFLLGGAAAIAAPGLGAPTRSAAADGYAALSGDRFVQGDAEYRLADITAPPLYTLDGERPVYFEESKAALQDLLDSHGAVMTDLAAPSRWGVKTVAAAGGPGGDFAAALVGAGAARVAPQTDDLARIDALLAAERKARREGRGLWAHDAYRVRRANDLDDAAGATGGYCLFEGTVRRAAQARSRHYLNFGDDYRNDVTASARNRLARRWSGAGLDLAALEGRRVRVRGFVEAINGPSIDLTHMRQVEIVDDEAGE